MHVAPHLQLNNTALHAVLALALATTSSCAELGLGDHTGIRAPNPRVLRITAQVTEHPTTDRWTVSWESSRPIAALRFRPAETTGRATTWTLGAGAVAWSTQGAADLLRATAGPLEHATATFPTSPAPGDPDDALHVTFSDGGRLLRTSHLDVEPLVCPDRTTTRCPDDSLRPWDGPVQRHWRLRTAPARTVRVATHSGAGHLDWHQTDPSPVGAYAYFGPASAEPSPHATHLLDPGLPHWMIDDVRAIGPAVLELYAAATGISPVAPPTVYVSWSEPSDDRRGLSARTLADHTLQLAVSGSAWREQTPSSRLRWLRFYAREAFHLWHSGDRQASYGPADDWLIEGGAHYLALLSLLETDTIDRGLFDRLVVQDANLCLLTLDGDPLATATRTGRRDAVYTCGSVLHAIADRAIQRATDGAADVRHLYRQLWLTPADDRVRTSTYSFMAALHALTGDATAAAPIGHLVHSGHPESADVWLQAQLVDRGLHVDLAPARSADLEPVAFLRPLARVLSRCDCNNQPKPATIQSGDLSFRPSDDCNLFRQGYRVAEVQTFHPGDSAVEAYTAVTDAVDSHRRVEISAERGGPTALLRCPPAAIDRSWTRLLRLPNQ